MREIVDYLLNSEINIEFDPMEDRLVKINDELYTLSETFEIAKKFLEVSNKLIDNIPIGNISNET